VKCCGACSGLIFFEHFGHFSELRRYAGYGTYSWAEKISQIYAGNLVKAAQICKAYHVEYAVFFQPLIFIKRMLFPK